MLSSSLSLAVNHLELLIWDTCKNDCYCFVISQQTQSSHVYFSLLKCSLAQIIRIILWSFKWGQKQRKWAVDISQKQLHQFHSGAYIWESRKVKLRSWSQGHFRLYCLSCTNRSGVEQMILKPAVDILG